MRAAGVPGRRSRATAARSASRFTRGLRKTAPTSRIPASARTGLADVGESKEGRASHRETKHQRRHGEWVVGDRAVALGDEVAAPRHEHHKGKEPTGHGCDVNPKGPGHHGWPRRPVGPPNGSRVSGGRRARWRKAVEPQKKRLGGEATELFPTCERPPASSAC